MHNRGTRQTNPTTHSRHRPPSRRQSAYNFYRDRHPCPRRCGQTRPPLSAGANMTQVVWNSPSSGNWSTPDWLVTGSSPQQFVVPDASDDAVANGTSLAPITIAFTGLGAAQSLSMSFATLDVQSGLLQLVNASGLEAITQSGGTLDFE